MMLGEMCGILLESGFWGGCKSSKNWKSKCYIMMYCLKIIPLNIYVKNMNILKNSSIK